MLQIYKSEFDFQTFLVFFLKKIMFSLIIVEIEKQNSHQRFPLKEMDDVNSQQRFPLKEMDDENSQRRI